MSLITGTPVRRPKRWDYPLDVSMTDTDVAWLRSREPFSSMDSRAFPHAALLGEILRNDCRLLRCEPGEIITRQGDYGGSALLILAGSVRVLVNNLPDEQLYRHSQAAERTWRQKLHRHFFKPSARETRRPEQVSLAHSSNGTPIRRVDDRHAIFLQDCDAVLGQRQGVTLGPRDMFGEVAAMYRLPRSATIVAENEATLIEIRWQGLRLLQADASFCESIEKRYREKWLAVHLRESSLLSELPEEAIARLVNTAELNSYGNKEWYTDYTTSRNFPLAKQIASETIIAEEGHSPTGLTIIRNGFARVTAGHGDSLQTLSYLGKGQAFGFDELCNNLQPTAGSSPSVLQNSLRAVGFVDTLSIPAEVFAEAVLPHLKATPKPHAPTCPSHLLDFVVANRFNNGHRAMVIDMDRCTDCNDCVRACADIHDGNARFARQGPSHGQLQFAQACMHCADPVCMIGCPTGSIARDESTGIVQIHEPICTGCGVCANACPYQNISMVVVRESNGEPYCDQETGDPVQKATMCDGCHSRPGGPACVSACRTNALVRIDLTEPSPLDSLMR
ncbi:putative ferredoxin-like protein YdhX precursor [Planctomycetes bacterium CA13]|uniref:Putative ferredoxin-like protein YdhX n=1 Tax=Novipirellula herctigrandis TaxID=2527986 RepID=A0A5C5YZZ8_9BACT|nr:putative ferredoxin-like protein YdhX precursor [Planctomycetes bacterium CA13]